MMTEGRIHIVASDTHMSEGKRAYDMDLGICAAKQIVGKATVIELFSMNPLAILENGRM